jgi:hypothetical protein
MVRNGAQLSVPSTEEVLRMTEGELDPFSRKQLIDRLARLRRVVARVNEVADQMMKAGKG